MDNKNIDPKNLYDVIIIGAGPAGLTAAIYLARARYRVLVLEQDRVGGQITISSKVVNYPGVKECDGAELTEIMKSQAESFGAEFLFAGATALHTQGDIKRVETQKGELLCFGVLIATGANPREVGFKGERELRGRGVAYCATCDGEFFTGMDIFVVGGGFAAAEESVFLTGFGKSVTVLIREDDFTCAGATADEARKHPKIKILTNTEVEEVAGDRGVNYIRYRNNKTGETTELKAPKDELFGVFVFAGYVPESSLAKGLAELDEQGYIVTDKCQKTTAQGLYAAGDVCQKPLRQVVTAVGDGGTAATELEKYAAAMREKTGLTPKREPAADSETAENSSLFAPGMREQLKAVFDKMESPITLRLYLLEDDSLSAELSRYMDSLCEMTPMLTVEKSPGETPDMPCVRVFRDGVFTGLGFHGVPGGHEFTSFVLGLYNASGKGQPIDEDTESRIKAISYAVNMKILVTLSCTMCPDLVTAAQKMATLNKNITAEVYDISRFPSLKERYRVMSVPCLVVNDEHIAFGRKNTDKLLQYIENLPET